MADEASMYEERYWAAQKALDEILGTEEEDGAGEGLVAEIYLVAEQRDQARAERDNALAEVARLTAERERLTYHENLRARIIADHQGRLIAADDALAERDALAARLERAERVVEAADALLIDAQVATSAVYNRIIAVLPEDSVREAWHRATCWACDWNTTGSDGVCEDAGHEHVADLHGDLVDVAQDAIGLLRIPLKAAVDTYRAATPPTPEAAP